MIKVSTLQEYNQVCVLQGVELHPDILWAVEKGTTNDNLNAGQGFHYALGPTYVAVAESGRLLCRDPELTLSSAPLKLDEVELQGVGLRTLGNIVNQSHERVPLTNDDT